MGSFKERPKDLIKTNFSKFLVGVCAKSFENKLLGYLLSLRLPSFFVCVLCRADMCEMLLQGLNDARRADK